MNVVIEFLRGIAFGIEFPGDGVNVVLELGIVRITFVSDEVLDGLLEDELEK